jgi:hypothetical protein
MPGECAKHLLLSDDQRGFGRLRVSGTICVIDSVLNRGKIAESSAHFGYFRDIGPQQTYDLLAAG